MAHTIPFDSLTSSDLLLDAVYKRGPKANLSSDPLSRILPGGNSGGFRFKGKAKAEGLRFVILYSTLDDLNWPDSLNLETGIFTYFGDNRTPGRLLHDTPRRGNEILRIVFDSLHQGTTKSRLSIPPFFVFTRSTESGDVIFRGLAVPGGIGISSSEDLVAFWRTSDGQRFQNYRAYFSILDVPCVSRSWLNDLIDGNLLTENCPDAYRSWVLENKYVTLRSVPSRSPRTKQSQIPTEQRDKKILGAVYDHFKDRPHAFEHCASKLVRLMEPKIISCDVTRPSKDGGRDAIGQYSIGLADNNIAVTFALEAKCYSPGTGVGVKDTSRLISRLRHRQFGIFVTTSYIGAQAYSEILEDLHPVVIICGVDIVKILRNAGLTTPDEVKGWLSREFAK